MGLASKLREANPQGASLKMSPSLTGQYQPPPPAGQYQPPPPTGQYQPPPPTGQYQPPPPTGQYQPPPPTGQYQPPVRQNHLETFYPPHRIQEIATKLGRVDFTKISSAWRIPLEIAFDLSAMALYDVVFYCDDSGSMQGAENGTRIDDLKWV
ncbi:hypothetical protein HDU67_008779 [Dinochytrium kinnereticum]|nr:hypothetical protein HDU67_008779 [Dinochytrium kinnereticum]